MTISRSSKAAKPVHNPVTIRRQKLAISKSTAQASPGFDLDALPDIYCMKLDGGCLEPLIPDGAAVVLKKSEAPKMGDIVCVYFHPRLLKPGFGPGWLKRMTLGIPPWVRFPYTNHPESEVEAMLSVEQINPHENYMIRCSDVIGLHKAIGWAPAGDIGGSIRSDTIRQIGA